MQTGDDVDLRRSPFPGNDIERNGGSPPLPDRTDLDRPDPRLSRPARVGNAPVVLSAAAAVRRIGRSDVELRRPDIGMSAELR